MPRAYAEFRVSPAGRRAADRAAADDGPMTEPERDPRTEAQREYDGDPELRELLTRAARSPTVRRARRVDDRAT